MKKKFMYQNEHSDRMVLFTDFNINPILLFSKKFTHAQLKNKLKACPSFREGLSSTKTSSDWSIPYHSLIGLLAYMPSEFSRPSYRLKCPFIGHSSS